MYQLLVSQNCGISYHLDCEAETVDELKPRMQELDEQRLRWSLDKDGEPCFDVMCSIHAGIFQSIIALRAKDEIGKLAALTVKKE